uniref:C-type lectin domain-containing protein n=1 Tax=Strongyloides venezuelensis TaxID=75913 RepID=A0A0K0FJZ6_STRVS
MSNKYSYWKSNDDGYLSNHLSEIESAYKSLIVYQGWMKVFEGFIPNQPQSSNDTESLNIEWHKGFCIVDPQEKSLICFKDKKVADQYCYDKITIRVDKIYPVDKKYKMFDKSNISDVVDEFSVPFYSNNTFQKTVNRFFSSKTNNLDVVDNKKACHSINMISYTLNNIDPLNYNFPSIPNHSKSATLSKLDVNKKIDNNGNCDLRNYNYTSYNSTNEKNNALPILQSVNFMSNRQTVPAYYYSSSKLIPIQGKFFNIKLACK